MERTLKAEAGKRAAPPISLTKCWDKAKWHFEAGSFPPNLPKGAGWKHIEVALGFLAERGQLTAKGKRELATLGEETALLSDQIKVGARAFLDQSYDNYLKALSGYDSVPPVHVLEAAWEMYSAEYDLSRRPQPNAYQRLLLDYAPDHGVDGLLRALNRVPELSARLRSALDHVPAADRSLIEATLVLLHDDPIALSSAWHDPTSLLNGLRYLDARRHAAARLGAALILDERLGIATAAGTARLSALVHAINLGATDEAEAAWQKLSKSEKDRLSEAANRLFHEGEQRYLALCAMRTVGDAQSLKLIDRSIGDAGEGSTNVGGHVEPSWEPVRREARIAIEARRRITDGY